MDINNAAYMNQTLLTVQMLSKHILSKYQMTYSVFVVASAVAFVLCVHFKKRSETQDKVFETVAVFLLRD